MLVVTLAGVSGRASPSGLVAVETVRRSGSDISTTLCFTRFRLAHALRGERNGFDDLGIAGAAAQIPGNRVANLFARQVGIVFHARSGRYKEGGRAVSALRSAALGEGLLHGMQLIVFGEALNGANPTPLSL